MESTLRRTWAEINLDALVHNYQTLCKHMGPNSGFVGVVKADSYGHGAVQVGRVLEELGAKYLAISNIDEARELRAGGVKLPILQLGLTPADQTPIIIANGFTQAIYSENQAQAFSAEAVKAGGTLKAHIKLDTGMSRLGFQCDEAHFDASLEAICRVAQLPGLELEGIFTHVCVSDETDPSHQEYTAMQYGRFTGMIKALEERGVNFKLRHCANSGATAGYPQFAHDLFRPGILTYGIGDQAPDLGLRPLMTLKTTIGCIKEYTPDTCISYGRTFKAEKPMRVGVLPIGYADGFHRALSSKWRVWTPYGMAPVVGRICMDMCMVDLTDLPEVKEGDEVEVYGEHNSVTEAAHLAGTISYELTCAVSKRVPRIYYRDGKEIYRELLLRG